MASDLDAPADAHPRATPATTPARSAIRCSRPPRSRAARWRASPALGRRDRRSTAPWRKSARALARLTPEQMATCWPAFWMHGCARRERGQFAAALDDLERGIALAAATGRDRVLLILAVESVAVLTELGRIREAVAAAEDGVERARLAGQPARAPVGAERARRARAAGGRRRHRPRCPPRRGRRRRSAPRPDFHAPGPAGLVLAAALAAGGEAGRALAVLREAFGAGGLAAVPPAERPVAAADLVEAQLAPPATSTGAKATLRARRGRRRPRGHRVDGGRDGPRPLRASCSPRRAPRRGRGRRGAARPTPRQRPATPTRPPSAGSGAPRRTPKRRRSRPRGRQARGGEGARGGGGAARQGGTGARPPRRPLSTASVRCAGATGGGARAAAARPPHPCAPRARARRRAPPHRPRARDRRARRRRAHEPRGRRASSCSARARSRRICARSTRSSASARASSSRARSSARRVRSLRAVTEPDPDPDPLEQLSAKQLHDLAVQRALRHADVRFFWKLLKILPAAEIGGGRVRRGRARPHDACAATSTTSPTAGRGETAEELRPFYLQLPAAPGG